MHTQHYVPVGKWFAVGFMVSIVHITIWLSTGIAPPARPSGP